MRKNNVLSGMLALFCILASAPAFAQDVEVSSLTPKQGQTIEVTVTDDTPSKGRAEAPSVIFNGESYPMFPARSQSEERAVYKGLVSIPADLDPGAYSLKVGDQALQLRVVDAKFPLQYLRLPRGKDNFKMSPGEEEAVEAAKATLSCQRHWRTNFVRPSKARVSSGFGLRRVVNGKLLKDYFHSGLDFAGGLGSPVAACAPGKVIIARTGWRLHGNTVAIDHGQGVVSFYIHLSKVLVKEGEIVKRGQLIGKIGQTGRASGPHLHFSIYVNKVAANPNYWFASAFM
ncbi:MAG TPA: M23 family metallopeptidase [Candidatus Obscuribacterales bacterium]